MNGSRRSDTRETSRPVGGHASGGFQGMTTADFSDILGSAPQAGKKPAPLYRAIYISHTRTRLEDRQMDKIMDELSKRYALRGVSGLLLYKSRSIFEILEGPQDLIDQTLETIFRDPRHYKMKVMLYQPARARRFDGWSMGFRRLDGTTSKHPAYFNLTRRELVERFPHGATKEILHFLRGYLNLRFPPPPPPEITVECKVNQNLAAYGNGARPGMGRMPERTA
jgi:hypothetical protein